MSYTQAKKLSIGSRFFGWLIFFICLIAFVISILKGLYIHFDNSPQLENISNLAKNLVDYIYQNTQFLNIFWSSAPTLNIMNPLGKSNMGIVGIYVALFIGASMVRYGRRLSKRLRRINSQIQDEVMKSQLRGIVKNEGELREVITIPSNTFHSLYLAPIVVGLLIPLIIFFFKKTFNF